VNSAAPASVNQGLDLSKWDLAHRIQNLIVLKDFAVQNGYDVPETLIDDISLFENYSHPPTNKSEVDENNPAKIDKLMIQLSQITYPVNGTNVENAYLRNGVTVFVYVLLIWGILSALASGFLIWFIKYGAVDSVAPIARAPLALCLGMVGAIVYVMLPNGKLNVLAGLDAESRTNDIVRVVMGAILGFVLFIASAISKNTSGGALPNGGNLDAMELLLPFIGGYSITLVVGILSKAVAAIALTFGIDEKSIRSSLQK
jgi:hypothetical protein